MKKCEHKTLHFEGKWLAYLVCSCGKKWERTVNYIQNTRYTFFRVLTKDAKEVATADDNHTKRIRND